jgi:hypothetical protein
MQEQQEQERQGSRSSTSKYIHCFWHVSHSSRVSLSKMSRFCHDSTSSRMGPQNREPRIVFSVTSESSSATCEHTTATMRTHA